MELKLKNDRVLDASELIFDSKKLIALGRLYHTLVSKEIEKESIEPILNFSLR
jgi:hypothetical protein